MTKKFSSIDALLADAWWDNGSPITQVRLTVHYAKGITSSEVANELASDNVPTEGIHHYNLHPAWDVTGGSLDIIGTPSGVARVVNHLRDLGLITGEVRATYI